MSKIITVGATAVFACILCATPLSLRLSPEGNVALSMDSASARIGRPLTATSVAGVNRRVHRRAYRQGYSEAAKADIAKLGELRDKLREAKDAYWSEQVDIQQKVASAWVLYAEGKYDDALKAMSAAADAEDKTEKHPVTPGVPKPARELYGMMLLERGMAKEALAAFEATLKKEPNRLAAYVGAAKAAEKSGDSAKAREYYGKVVAIASNADNSRAEVADARAYLR
jgi:tetratricopeptide (TPR) repeat protein